MLWLDSLQRWLEGGEDAEMAYECFDWIVCRDG